MSHTAASGAGAKKRFRAVVTDVSREFALALLRAPLGRLATAEDVRRVLAEPLPCKVLLSLDYLQLSLACEGIFSFEVQDFEHESSMTQLVVLLHSALDCSVTSGSEEVWASAADGCTGRVWRLLSALLGTFTFRDDRNRTASSGVTKTSLRPDYTAYASGALVAKAEHKATPAELITALDELVSKMNGGWNPLAMRGAPFLPCYAVGGELLQFAVVVPPTGGAGTRAVTVSDQFVLSTAQGRLSVVRAACNMFRILVWLRSSMPGDSLPLYAEQMRSDGGSITVFDDHVIKRTLTIADDAVYAAVLQLPHAIRVTVISRHGRGGFSRLRLQPVAIERRPRSEVELQRAVRCVLRALSGLHARGFVHRDVRWPNVLHDGSPGDSDGGWILSDFELASTIGAAIPPLAIKPSLIAPEMRADGAMYTPAADVWQVGQLVHCTRFADGGLSAAGHAFAAALTAEPSTARPSAAEALLHEWLRL